MQQQHETSKYFRYQYRWVLDYARGDSKYGLWHAEGILDDHLAHKQTRLGLVRARIEGFDKWENQIFTIVECSADNFLEFKVLKMKVMPVNYCAVTKPIIIGMMLITRAEKFTVYCNGDYPKAEPNNDRNAHSLAWSRK